MIEEEKQVRVAQIPIFDADPDFMITTTDKAPIIKNLLPKTEDKKKIEKVKPQSPVKE